MKELTCRLSIAPDSDFSIYNLPFGIFSNTKRTKRPGIAIGHKIVDLKVVHQTGLLDHFGIPSTVLEEDTLNSFIALGKPITSGVRETIQKDLCAESSVILNNPQCLVDRTGSEMHLPVSIGDYTDFYSSIEHATNVGKMFRDPENALLPNWKHLPVGYHGRSSSIVSSGVDIRRPMGQTKTGDAPPQYGPCRLLDFELEMAFIIGKSSTMGSNIPIEKAEDHIFGLVLFNDWSARDIQKWEYVPLGPFLGKSFASSISPWIVTLEALDFLRVDGPTKDVEVLPYLQIEGAHNFDLNLDVELLTENGGYAKLSSSNSRNGSVTPDRKWWWCSRDATRPGRADR